MSSLLPPRSSDRAIAVPRTLVVNLNAPELNALAQHLAAQGRLAGFVRPYVNKGRPWERTLAGTPWLGPAWRSSFGRRRVGDRSLVDLTDEAGVAADLASALVTRLPWLSVRSRHRMANRLRMLVRDGVSRQGARRAQDDTIDCVVAYEGFAWHAWQALGESGRPCARVLNYPVAHHRLRMAVRDEEIEREPDFAVTWPGFDDWGPGHAERLDAEIAMAHRVLVGSRYAADSFVAAGVPADRMSVVPYGVNLSLFSPPRQPPAARPFQVVFTGQLTQRKGLSYLLKGYRVFRRLDTRLVLVGSIVGSAQPLQAFAGDFVHVDHQTRPDLADHYRRSHVFVLPTLVEGMPLVVLEAMASGLPVIVTANGPADIVRDGVEGFIVPERDPMAIAERLERLYRDEDLRRTMGAAARARARAFSWRAFGEGAQRCLHEAAAEARPQQA